MSITSDELACGVLSKIGDAYAWGGIGKIVTESWISAKKIQYPATYSDEYIGKCHKNIGKRAFDCVGLIKFHVWGNGDSLKKYDPSTDITADAAFRQSASSGEIGSIPEIPGICVYKKGHVGIYVGSGKVVEARGIDFGVVKTNLPTRGFTHWFEYPGVAYPSDYLELESALALLHERGVIDTPEYWRKNATKLDYLDTLIIKFAHHLER